MKDLEKNYNENKENCEHLIPKKNALVLAAKPLDFMEIFRFVFLSVFYFFTNEFVSHHTL